MGKITDKITQRIFQQQYRLVGQHSAVKICHWTKQALRDKGVCYKQQFYGINTLGCLEITPALTCNQRCRHCWRDSSLLAKKTFNTDQPIEIIKRGIEERKKLLIGFKGNKKVDQERFKEALLPNHAAISLIGEPCLYKRLPELIEEFYKQGFKSVFLVTNGTFPEIIKRISQRRLPDNLYLSLEASNEKDYLSFCSPIGKNFWPKILETMGILKNLRERTRTVMRITCIKGFNLDKAEEFARLVETMKPRVIETKAYEFVGGSRLRMKKENTPSFDEVYQFARELERISGYKINDSVKISRVVKLEGG